MLLSLSHSVRHDRRRSPAFTLIELLVVIAIIALLMSILMPCLQRVRKQARAVRCQGNLRQWGVVLTVYALDNNGLLPWWNVIESGPGYSGVWYWGERIAYWDGSKGVFYDPPRWSTGKYKGILTCPAASTPANKTGKGNALGGTFLAWGLGVDTDSHETAGWIRGFGSYGKSLALEGNDNLDENQRNLRAQDVKYPARIPVFMDSAWYFGCLDPFDPPPPCDAIPTSWYGVSPRSTPFCMNRHDGCVNGLFLDWSVRRVGVKELWTLTWLRNFNTAGSWTKAGGAQPEDWPQWMRRFKDY